MSAVAILVVAGYVAIEILAATLLASWIGWGWVVIIVLALMIVGCAVMRRAGIAAARGLRAGAPVTPLQAGGPAPGAAAAVGDASLLFVAGLLIAIPGLVSSLLGILMLIRPVRRLLGGGIVVLFTRRLRRRGLSMTSTYDASGMRVTRIVPGDVVEGEVINDPAHDGDDREPPAPPSLPR